MDWAEARDRVQATEGLLSDAETECLYLLAKKCGGSTIVEIGSWKGKSTVCLALGSKAGGSGKVFAIDPHSGLADSCAKLYYPEDTGPIFRENIKRARVDDIVTPLVMKSEEAAKGWTEPISLLWIDGAHDYENVKKDFLLWEPYLKKDGVIAFHDALYSLGHNYPGIRKVMYKYIFQSNSFSNVHFCGSIVCATKVVSLSMQDRLLKLSRLPQYYLLPLVYTIGNIVTRILARMGLLGPIKVIKDRMLTSRDI